jgi:hypothetical protein
MYSAGQIACGESAMPHRNARNLDADHNGAIRVEIGERLCVLLSKEQPSPPPRIQHLLDRLSKLDATAGGAKRTASVGDLFHFTRPAQPVPSIARTRGDDR